MSRVPPCILLVDDEKLLVETTRLILENEGYRVLAAPNAEEALRLFATTGVDIAIIDLSCSRSDGTFLPKAFKSAKPQVKTILFSGNPEAVLSCDKWVDLLLAKPLPPKELLAALAKARAGSANH